MGPTAARLPSLESPTRVALRQAVKCLVSVFPILYLRSCCPFSLALTLSGFSLFHRYTLPLDSMIKKAPHRLGQGILLLHHLGQLMGPHPP